MQVRSSASPHGTSSLNRPTSAAACCGVQGHGMGPDAEVGFPPTHREHMRLGQLDPYWSVSTPETYQPSGITSVQIPLKE